MAPIISVTGLSKKYDGGFEALKNLSLDIETGEIIALLGPNGAGKTTLISAICGLVSITVGSVKVGGFDIVDDYRNSRRLVGLVPQEVVLEPFETVINTVSFSRGLFGYPANPALIEQILRKLSLWEKRNSPIKELSGGMKRRVLIAKALSHEPKILFLDEPTAGVDVELRKDMWRVVEELKRDGVTIVLTTHYIEEAEAIADRVAVISAGTILLVEEKETLMKQMGEKQMKIYLQSELQTIPDSLSGFGVSLSSDGLSLLYQYDINADRTGITSLLTALSSAGIVLKDVETSQSSLEDIFVSLVKAQNS